MTRARNTPRAARAPRRRERGSFVVLVSVLGLLVMAFWTSAYRATHDALRTERQLANGSRHAALVDEGLRVAVDALGRADPPRSPFTCRWHAGTRAEGGWVVAEYTRDRGGRWRVEVHPASEREVAGLPRGDETWR